MYQSNVRRKKCLSAAMIDYQIWGPSPYVGSTFCWSDLHYLYVKSPLLDRTEPHFVN